MNMISKEIKEMNTENGEQIWSTCVSANCIGIYIDKFQNRTRHRHEAWGMRHEYVYTDSLKMRLWIVISTYSLFVMLIFCCAFGWAHLSPNRIFTFRKNQHKQYYNNNDNTHKSPYWARAETNSQQSNNKNQKCSHTVLTYTARLYYYFFKANEIHTLIANTEDERNGL